MKYFGVFVIFCLAITNVWSLSEEMQELANMLHKMCQEETGVPEDAIVNARTGNFADDNTLKCYMKCIFVQMAVIDEDNGQIDTEAVIGILPDEHKEMGAKIINGCGTKVGVDICDNAFLTNKCYYEGAPDHYFLP